MPERPDESTRPLLLAVGGAHAGCSPGELAAALAALELRCEHVADGAAAVATFAQLRPALVVIDVARSEMDGPEVFRALDSLRESAGVPMVIVVDPSDREAMASAFASGATDIVDDDASAEFVAQRARFLLRAAARREQTDQSVGFDRTTGFADRSHFIERLTYAISEAREDGHAVGVVCLELDRFRDLVYGLPHAAVDQLLLAVARRLQDAVRKSDVIANLEQHPENASFARIGGGEFAILLESLVRAEDAATVGRRLLDELSESIHLDGREITVSASVGISSFPTESGSAEDLLGFAQTATYCAKQEGRDTVKFYQPSMNSRAFERLSLESSLRHALVREEFRVYYQPRVEISTGRLISFEALVRWQHPELGLVSPAQFIPLAEETGLIVPIGEWVLRTACARNRAWQQEGYDPVSVSVNLSSAQFRHPDLYDTVVRTLGETGLDPQWLELELTESLLMQNAEAVEMTLKRFRDTGIHLSIDDFGTGYSSLSYLKRFPIDALKIDQSFIREVTTNADDAALATSIILMGRSLKLRVVAEGVETESQLSFLKIMQCDEVQGYLYSPPVPAEDAVVFLRDGFSRTSAA